MTLKIEITWDDGAVSGNAGWMYRDQEGDWRSINDPFGPPPMPTLDDDWRESDAHVLAARIRRYGFDVEIV